MLTRTSVVDFSLALSLILWLLLHMGYSSLPTYVTNQLALSKTSSFFKDACRQRYLILVEIADWHNYVEIFIVVIGSM